MTIAIHTFVLRNGVHHLIGSLSIIQVITRAFQWLTRFRGDRISGAFVQDFFKLNWPARSLLDSATSSPPPSPDGILPNFRLMNGTVTIK